MSGLKRHRGLFLGNKEPKKHSARASFLPRLFSVNLFWIFIVFLQLPRTAESQTTYFPATGVYNTYLNQINILECDSSSERPTHPELKLLSSSGTVIKSLYMNIPAKGSQHIILNDLYNIVDTYGTYRLVLPSGEELLGDKISCRTAFYRPASPGANKPYDFAYVLPVRNPDTGLQYGAYNSYSPDGSNIPTYNWMSIVNLSDKPLSADVDLFDSLGNQIATKKVTSISPNARLDIAMGHDLGQVVGTYRISPNDPTQKYQAFLMRYGFTNSSYKFAFPLRSLSGNCTGNLIQLSTTGSTNTANWLEIVNLNDIEIPVTIIVRDKLGLELKRFIQKLPALSQYHLFANSIIDPENQGSTGSAQVICRDPSDRIITESLFYGRSEDSTILWAYASQETGNLGAVAGTQLVAPVNTYLGMANWLKLANMSTESIMDYDIYDNGGNLASSGEQTLASRGTADIGIHAEIPADRIGAIATSSATSGSRFTGELLRIVPSQSGEIGTIVQIPAIIQRRGISGQHDADGDTSTGFIGDPQSLSQYRDELTYQEVSHLLGRANLGARHLEITAAQLNGLQKTINQMTTIEPTPALDAAAVRWIDDNYDTYSEIIRSQGVQKYWLHHMIYTPNPLRERLALIWNDILAASCRVVANPVISNSCYFHANLLRRHALGNFKTLATGITTDYMMLKWLNGNLNVKGSPDENYAREFWELFTLGETSKHTGRYRLYDSLDIAQAARAFTGWTTPFPVVQDPNLKPIFVASKFDTGVKTIFHGTPYETRGNLNHTSVINKTLERPETAQWIVKRLFTALVHDHPSASVVNELADLLQSGNYEVLPVVKKILLSEAMFSTDARKSRIKDAVTYGIGFVRSTGIPTSARNIYLRFVNDGMGYEPLNPPSVNGWPLNKYKGANLSEYFLGWTTSYPNYIREILKSAESIAPGFSFSSLIPFPGAAVPEIVDHWAKVLGIQLTVDERTRLISYMNTQRQTDGTNRNIPFDSTNTTHVRQKIPGLLWILSQHEDYFTF